MNEILNLEEILKDCPKGTKLYSTILGEVKLYKVKDNNTYPIGIEDKEGTQSWLTSNGKFIESFDGECTLFPSKYQRDWSEFTAPWYKKEMYTNSMSNKDDEILRKTAIAFLKDFAEQGYENAVECIDWLENQGEQEEPQVYETEDGEIITYSETDGYKFDEPNFHENEREWIYIVSDVLTWKDGIGQYLDDKRVQEFAKKLCSKYAKKLYNSSVLSNL